MSFEKNVKQVISFEYDFAIDGGGLGAKVLRSLGPNKLRPGLVVEAVELKMDTAMTSGGSATAVVGTPTDDDGFFTTVFAMAAGAVAKGSGAQATGSYIVPGTVNGDKVTNSPVLTIGTAALTAGKFKLDIHCYLA